MVDTPELATLIVETMNGPDDEEARKRWGMCWEEVRRERQHRDRLQVRIEAARLVVNELRAKWYSEEGRASLALIASELDGNAG